MVSPTIAKLHAKLINCIFCCSSSIFLSALITAVVAKIAGRTGSKDTQNPNGVSGLDLRKEILKNIATVYKAMLPPNSIAYCFLSNIDGSANVKVALHCNLQPHC